MLRHRLEVLGDRPARSPAASAQYSAQSPIAAQWAWQPRDQGSEAARWRTAPVELGKAIKDPRRARDPGRARTCARPPSTSTSATSAGTRPVLDSRDSPRIARREIAQLLDIARTGRGRRLGWFRRSSLTWSSSDTTSSRYQYAVAKRSRVLYDAELHRAIGERPEAASIYHLIVRLHALDRLQGAKPGMAWFKLPRQHVDSSRPHNEDRRKVESTDRRWTVAELQQWPDLGQIFFSSRGFPSGTT